MYLNKEDIASIKKQLLYIIYYFQSRGCKFINIKQMTIFSLSCRCNMAYEYYIKQPMSMCERKINMIIGKNPKLINSFDRNKNHPLVRKYSHIPFNN